MALTAARLHARARRRLDGLLRSIGFERVPKTATAAWMREQGDGWLFAWFQPSNLNGPHAPGFRFVVELRLSSRPVMYAAGRMARLPALLPGTALEQARAVENRAIASLGGPDPAYLAALPAALRGTVLADWRSRPVPYEPGEHVWFRAADEADLDELLDLIARELPGAVDRFLASAPAAGGV